MGCMRGCTRNNSPCEPPSVDDREHLDASLKDCSTFDNGPQLISQHFDARLGSILQSLDVPLPVPAHVLLGHLEGLVHESEPDQERIDARSDLHPAHVS